MKEEVQWLENNVIPEETVIEYWDKTFQFRQRVLEKGISVIDYFKKYICLKLQLGINVVSQMLHTINTVFPRVQDAKEYKMQ